MCGIVGIVSAKGGRLEARVTAMAESLAHRGPDGSGIWSSTESGIAFGHRRLAILDLSPLGRQPMLSESGKIVITFNGEIYNFQEIRSELEQRGVRFRSQCDTEVLVEAVACWGVQDAVRRCRGMFAFGVFNQATGELTLVRDRFGIKPLYYGWVNGEFLFGSELKPFLCAGEPPKISRQAVNQFLRFGYIPAPLSIYESVYKLLPGCSLTFPVAHLAQGFQEFSPLPGQARFSPIRFWRVPVAGERKVEGSDEELLSGLEKKVIEAIKIRLISDVPLGAFLSGGIDSSCIVSLMQEMSNRPIRTFSIGFEEAEYNEAVYAQRVAQHIGTEHTELYLSEKDARDVIPLLPKIYDEPFADSSQIPTYLVSKLARNDVTVSLSGDGGDELFSGYQRYELMDRIWSMAGRVPPGIRVGAARLALCLPKKLTDIALVPASLLVPKHYRKNRIGDRMQRGFRLLAQRDYAGMYTELFSHWDGDSPVTESHCWSLYDHGSLADGAHVVGRAGDTSYIDLHTYLPDDILTKVDRASMFVGLEARVPLLDHHLAEYVLALPFHLRAQGATRKILLKKLLYKRVPRELVERQKQGFSVPIAEWLRGDLRDWAEDLLETQKLKDQGLLNAEAVRKKWIEHVSGQENWSYDLWDVLMLQSWMKEYRP